MLNYNQTQTGAVMTINSQNLKEEVAKSSIILKKLKLDLKEGFKRIENDAIRKGIDGEELDAYRFLEGLVETHLSVIDEMEKIFRLCIAAHQEYDEPMKFYRFAKVVFSVKFVMITILGSLMLAGYKYIGGE